MASYDGKRIDLGGTKAMLMAKHISYSGHKTLKKPQPISTNPTTK
jgi:hypothetical protein